MILGEAFVAVNPETTGFGSLEMMLKNAIGAIPMPAVFAAVVGGAAVAAFSIGESFEGAYRTIRSGTGATEEQMKGLEDSFKNVLKSGPASMNAVADAITLVSQRTKLSGADLEAFTQTELKLARITKTDVKDLVDQTTKAFANYGIQGLAPSKLAMEGLLQVSQHTGISVTALASAVSGKAGASFRALGVDITSAASIMGTLEAAGVSTGPVIMSLSKAITEAQKSGKDAKTALADIFDTLKNGTPGTAAYEAAIKSLGSRGFQSLRDAVQTGKLGIEEFSGSMQVIPGQIDRIAKENQTLGGLFQTLKNQALVALEPISMAFLNLLNVGIRGAVDGITDFVNGFRNGTDEIGSAQSVWAQWGATAYEYFTLIKQAWDSFVGAFVAGDGDITSSGFNGYMEQLGAIARQVWDFLQANWEPLLIALGAAMFIFGGSFLTVGAGFAILYTRSEAFRNAVNAIVEVLIVVGRSALEFGQVLVATVGPMIGDFVVFFIERWDKIHAAVKNVLLAIGVAIAIALAPAFIVWKYFHDQILAVVMLVWDQVTNLVRTAVRVIGDIFDLVIAILTGQWGDAWNAIKDIFGAAFDYLTATLGNLLGFVIDFFGSLPGNILAALGDLVTTLGPKGLELLKGLADGVMNGWQQVALFFISLPVLFLGFMAGAVVWLVTSGYDVIVGLWQGLVDSWPTIVQFFTDLPGNVLAILAAAPSWLVGIGGDVISGLWSGIQSMFSWFVHLIEGIPGWIKDNIGDTSTLLWDAAVNMIVGLWQGILSMKDWLLGKLGDLAGSIKDKFMSAFKIWSPSRVFYGYGQLIGEGLGLGLESMTDRVAESQRRAFAGLGKANLPDMAAAFQSPGVQLPTGPSSSGDLASALQQALSAAQPAGPLVHIENATFGSADTADADYLAAKLKMAGI